MVATVLAGGAVAATGQVALDRSLPVATDGVGVLTTGVHEMLVGADPSPAVSAPATAAAASPLAAAATAEARPVDVSGLVKATELHRRAADRAAETARAETARAETARAEAARAEAARAEAARVEAARAEAARAAAEKRAQARAAERAAAAAPRPRSADRAQAGGAVQLVAGRVTSGFGARWGRAHRGLDIAAPIGTPVRAPLAGTVIDAGPAGGFGMWVRLRHADGTVTTYGHVNRALVSVGATVAAGQKIAEVGNRGQSTGPHLHVEVQTPGGATVNPRPWLDRLGVGY